MSASAYELDLKNVEKSVINTVRAAIGVSGAVSLIIGVLILVWPVKTAVVVAGIVAVYAVIAGVVNLAIGIFSRRLGGWARFGFLALGVVFLIAAVVSFSNLGAAAAGLAVLVGVLFGISWIVEGVVGLTLIGDSASKVWTIVYALISIVGRHPRAHLAAVGCCTAVAVAGSLPGGDGHRADRAGHPLRLEGGRHGLTPARAGIAQVPGRICRGAEPSWW